MSSLRKVAIASTTRRSQFLLPTGQLQRTEVADSRARVTEAVTTDATVCFYTACPASGRGMAGLFRAGSSRVRAHRATTSARRFAVNGLAR